MGILLVEYMNDGTINNRVFNIASGATILFILPSIISPLVYVFGGSSDAKGAVFFHTSDVGFPADIVDEFSTVARRLQNFINSVPVVWIE